MYRTTAKIWITVACSIILLHAFVPHHHHDCRDEAGFVFENELNCHCGGCEDERTAPEAREHHHHPFNTCKLQDLLSQLVLNTKEDEHLWNFAHLFITYNLWDASGMADRTKIAAETEACEIIYGDFIAALPPGDWTESPTLRGPPESLYVQHNLLTI